MTTCKKWYGLLSDHKWKYETDFHRICLKCGRTEQYHVAPMDNWWSFEIFSDWKKSVKQYKSKMAKDKLEKLKALKYVKSL